MLFVSGSEIPAGPVLATVLDVVRRWILAGGSIWLGSPQGCRRLMCYGWVIDIPAELDRVSIEVLKAWIN